jgi:hypothetical protein
MNAAAVRAERDGVVRCEHLPEVIGRRVLARRSKSASPRTTSEPPLEAVVARDAAPNERELRIVLKRMRGNMAGIAEYFGKNRKQIYRWCERYGIDLAEYREDDGP